MIERSCPECGTTAVKPESLCQICFSADVVPWCLIHRERVGTTCNRCDADTAARAKESSARLAAERARAEEQREVSRRHEREIAEARRRAVIDRFWTRSKGLSAQLLALALRTTLVVAPITLISAGIYSYRDELRLALTGAFSLVLIESDERALDREWYRGSRHRASELIHPTILCLKASDDVKAKRLGSARDRLRRSEPLNRAAPLCFRALAALYAAEGWPKKAEAARSAEGAWVAYGRRVDEFGKCQPCESGGSVRTPGSTAKWPVDLLTLVGEAEHAAADIQNFTRSLRASNGRRSNRQNSPKSFPTTDPLMLRLQSAEQALREGQTQSRLESLPMEAAVLAADIRLRLLRVHEICARRDYRCFGQDSILEVPVRYPP
jgi:hypothetical protein